MYERISFSAPVGTLDALREYADETDLTVSQVVRAGLRHLGLESDECQSRRKARIRVPGGRDVIDHPPSEIEAA